MNTRRSFLQKTSVGAAAVVAAGTLGVSLKKGKAKRAELLEGTPQTWIHEVLEPGRTVMNEWVITSVSPIFAGGIIVNLHHVEREEVMRIDVCQKDRSGVMGVEATNDYELILMNGGTGHTMTERNQHLVVRAIAHELGSVESNVRTAPLLSHRDRLDIFGAEKLHLNPVQA
jgi:hypothetical protein